MPVRRRDLHAASVYFHAVTSNESLKNDFLSSIGGEDFMMKTERQRGLNFYTHKRPQRKDISQS